MGCVSDQLLAAWAAGQVGGGERDVLEEHAAGCALCRGVMLGLVGVTRTAAPGPGEVFEPKQAGQRIRATDDALRQAQALTKIQHPSLQRVTGVELLGDELELVTEPVVGVSLGEWLERPRTQSQRAAILAAVGRALNVLHAHGIAHGAVTKDHVVVLRGAIGAVLIRPVLGSTPKDDQVAWWRLVVETIGRPRLLRGAIAKGLSNGYPSMDGAVQKLRSRAGDRAWRLWAMPIIVGLATVGAITKGTGGKSFSSSTTDECDVTATRDWNALRVPVTARLAVTGADTERMVSMINYRVTVARLQQQACGKAACIDGLWEEHRELLTEIAGRNTRDALDELLALPRPELCKHGMAATTNPAIRSEIRHVALDPSIGRLQRLLALQLKVEAYKDDGVSALWHYKLGEEYVRGDNANAGAAELEAAANAAKRSDANTFARVLIAQLALTDDPDSNLEKRAERRSKRSTIRCSRRNSCTPRASFVRTPAMRTARSRSCARPSRRGTSSRLTRRT
jgi:hypothetical protein